jgi:hypothetical protein
VELDKDRLAKLLNLTESEHDGEALSAIRKANELLRLHRMDWPAALGLLPPETEEPVRPEAPRPPPADRPIYTPQPEARRAPEMPPSFQTSRAYRDAFRREPLLPRLLGFPFWIVVELIAVAAPHKLLNTRGPRLAMVFTLSMMLGILAWISLGYFLLLGFDFG